MQHYTCPKCGGFNIVRSKENTIPNYKCTCGETVTLQQGKINIKKPTSVKDSVPAPSPIVEALKLPQAPQVFNPSAQIATPAPSVTPTVTVQPPLPSK